MNRMSLKTRPIKHRKLCYGWKWHVDDIDELAKQVALITLGKHRHAISILRDSALPKPKFDADDRKAAKNHISKGDTRHRNGWLFQAISWIAANSESSSTITRMPQYPKAHKGFDNFQIIMNVSKSTIIGVIVSEDKAVKDARRAIRDDVFPGFEKIENRERITEVTHEVTGMIDQCAVTYKGFDKDNAINNSLWKYNINYRASVTIEKIKIKKKDRKRIFKGYNKKVQGKNRRRMANTFHIKNLDDWMDKFANLVISKIESM